MSLHVPTVILGAGAAGMMCAAHAGPGTVVLDHMSKPGEKIRISGGGRCNFTNLYAAPANFISQNEHFAKSALSRYTQWDFIELVDRHKIGWHEKTLGQLFCDDSARQIIDMLVAELRSAGAELWLGTSVNNITHDGSRYVLNVTRDGAARTLTCDRLVVACGGKSIPKIGASDLGYRTGRQFGHALVETRPGLVPLTFGGDFTVLAGVATHARLTCNGTSFDEALLFTHRGLSGPAVLQISSYWQEGQSIQVHLRPDMDLREALRQARQTAGRRDIATVLAEHLPKRLAQARAKSAKLIGNLADQSDAKLDGLMGHLNAWDLTPTGTEGYRKAEVTLGGIDTDGLNARDLSSKHQRGLYFIGEAVDVTGWLGGYNFQWAWASGVAAGKAIAKDRLAAG